MQSINRAKPIKNASHKPARPNAINDEIIAKEVRLIDVEGEQLGITSIEAALARADEVMLDLVEISPTAVPPVCKIMDYSKYLFEKSKEEKAKLKTQRAKQVETAEIRLRPATDDHDYQTKIRQMRNFIERGDKVKVTLRLKGREMAHQAIALGMMTRIKDDMQDVTLCESFPNRMEGRQMHMLLAPAKSSK